MSMTTTFQSRWTSTTTPLHLLRTDSGIPCTGDSNFRIVAFEDAKRYLRRRPIPIRIFGVDALLRGPMERRR